MSRRETTVARQVLLLQVALLVLLVAGGVGFAYWDARRDSLAAATDEATAVALSVADSPDVLAGVRSSDPTAALQPFAEQVRRDTGTDFVVVMSTDGVRYTHPDTSVIGQTFRGHIEDAVAGGRVTERYVGTLGPSVRTVVPVRADADVVALVAVGISTETVDRDVLAAVPPILAASAIVTVAGVGGALLVNRRLRRQTHGLGAAEITRMYEYYDAVLHAVREGLVLLDRDGRVSLLNEEARRLLAVGDDVVGRPAEALGLEPRVTDTPVADSVELVGDRVLVVNHAPATWEGREVGSVLTLRDRTELQDVTAELDTVRGLADTLRAQNHESANRLHTMVSLIELGRPDEAVTFATRELEMAQELADTLVGAVEEPIVAALLLGKSTQAVERGVELLIDDGTAVSGLPMTSHDLVTVLGNLLDNAIDAASPGGTVRVLVEADDEDFHLVVDDSGPGIAPADRAHVFERGWSTKSDDGTGRGIGLSLVGQAVQRFAGTIDVGDSPLGGARFEIELSAVPA